MRELGGTFQEERACIVVVTVQQLAALVRGQVYGDGARLIRDARPLSEAGFGHVTFIETERLARHLKTCQASAILVLPALRAKFSDAGNGNGNTPGTHALGAPEFTFIEVADPLAAFVAAMRHFRGEHQPPEPCIAPQAVVHPTARVGPGATIGPFAVIGERSVVGARCRFGAGVVVGRNCTIGEDVTLQPHVVLYDGTVLGDRVEIHACAVIGADGFGYRLQDGKHVKVQQFGVVEIGDDVEIGAGTMIDRGTFHNTRVGAGTKIDNHVQIGHNCQIGKHNLLVSQVGIAGSVTTGDHVVLAGQVGVSDHVSVGAGTVVGAQSGLYHSVAEGLRMLGCPARPEGEQKRILACMEKLPEMRRELRQLRQHLGLETKDEADKETRGQGHKETRRQGDKGTRRQEKEGTNEGLELLG
jgi:UDP-3-O-[3-hydroxymyristoyl] glucosamine N-acyltransferase